jgi:hypothetical protein
MKLPVKIAFLIVVVFLSLQKMQAQEEKTMVCDSAFLVKINELILKNEGSKKEAREYYTNVLNTWNSGYYNQQAQTEICEISHNLLEVRKAPYDVYKIYLETLISFSKKVDHRKNFKIFHYLLSEYCNKTEVSLTRIGNFIYAVRNLIDNRLLFDAPLTKWKTSNDQYLFTLNSDNNLTIILPLSTLTCYAQDDSIKIFETSGFYDFSTYKFAGMGGKVTWERAGFPADSVYATFDKFNFELDRSLLIVDTATFYNSYYFDIPLQGTLRYQAAKIDRPAAARFPKFESFQKRFFIKDLYDQVDYTGGYVQHGSQFIGSGSKQEPAILSYWRKMKVVENGDTVFKSRVFMQSSSEEYTFTKEKVFTNNAVISMYMDEDSIYHPGLNMQYFVNSREINLLRNNDPSNMSRSPYFDSYHKIEITAELLKWNMNDTRIFFTRMIGSESSEAVFESYNYFATDRYYRIQGIAEVHPLHQVRELVQKIHSETFSADQLAKHMRYDISKVRQLLMILSFEGYIYYDKENQTATVRQKLHDYLQAATRQKDYDVITIKSTSSGKVDNAILELKNLDLQINGIFEFEFSKTNRVVSKPNKGQIILKKDRQIEFDGILRAGLYTYYGKKFHFNYQDFKIELESVDSLVMEVSKGIDLSGHHVLEPVRSKIEDISGVVYIDNPGNKSGTYVISRFPIFESTKHSFVFYDAPSIHGGVYNRDSVFFELDPYKLDSLNNPEAEKLKLKGRFVSGNIFPEFREVLTVQKDYSLGFSHDRSQVGITTYGKKGTTTGIIEISNQGLKVKGHVDYLRTTNWSDDFTYFLDSMNTLSKRFLNRSTSKPSLPLMEGKEIDIHWEPYNDKMFGKTTKIPLDMFNAQSTLKGGFVVEPKEITGSGLMAIERSTLKSDLYKYTEHTIDAAKSEWKLASIDKQNLALKTDDVHSHIDFTTRQGKFLSNDPNNIMYFPVNQYMAYADEVNWNIDNDKLAISTASVHSFSNQRHNVETEATTTNPAGTLFISTHARQDSLNFISPIADIDLKNNILFTKEVKFVHVADASIFPSDGNVTIEPDARHRALPLAKVLASRETKFHTMYDATINITGRLFYSGDGYYDYIDLDKKVQKIRFSVISVNKENTSTYATGKIFEDQSFTLNPAFAYMGNVSLFAQNKHLLFEGTTKLLSLPKGFAQHWIKFRSEIVPENVLIPVGAENESINLKKLQHSLITNMDSVVTYPTFFAETTRPNFHPYSSTPGYMRFERENKKYEVGSLEKLQNLLLKDNFVSLNTQSGDFFSAGEINMVRDLGQVKLKTRGSFTQSKERKEIIADLFLTLDFFFNEANLEYLADTLNKLQSLGPINTLGTDYELGMTDLIGSDALKALIEEQKLFGIPKNIPKGFKNSFVFTDVNMRWDSTDQAFKSFGKIGIGNILEKSVNKFVDGSIEIRYVKSKPEFIIYLEPEPNHWYFFKYTLNSMLSVSSDPVYNERLEKIKLKNRKLKAEGAKYTYYLTYPRVKDESLFYFKGGKKEDLNKKGKKVKGKKEAESEIPTQQISPEEKPELEKENTPLNEETKVEGAEKENESTNEKQKEETEQKKEN